VKKTILCAVLFAAIFLAAPMLSAQVSIGIRIGPPPRPREVYVMPSSPGPAYVWIGGYWYPVGRHYRWHEGYWTFPPYEGARWVEPRHDGEQFFAGYWEGDRGRVDHDHHWDRDRNRDRDRYRDDQDRKHDQDHEHDHDDHH
jgi:WXXGXW repeat (2 copies)